MYLRVSVWVSTSDTSSSGNPSRLPGQPAPTSWCMRSRWSGVAATTAQPYLITNKRVVPSVRYQAFSTKQTVIPASQTLALLSLPTTWWELHRDQRSNYTPYLTPISNTYTHTHTPNYLNIFGSTRTYTFTAWAKCQCLCEDHLFSLFRKWWRECKCGRCNFPEDGEQSSWHKMFIPSKTKL